MKNKKWSLSRQSKWKPKILTVTYFLIFSVYILFVQLNVYLCLFLNYEFYPLNFSCFIHVENDFNRLSLHKRKRTIVVNSLPHLKRTRWTTDSRWTNFINRKFTKMYVLFTISNCKYIHPYNKYTVDSACVIIYNPLCCDMDVIFYTTLSKKLGCSISWNNQEELKSIKKKGRTVGHQRKFLPRRINIYEFIKACS